MVKIAKAKLCVFKAFGVAGNAYVTLEMRNKRLPRSHLPMNLNELKNVRRKRFVKR